MPLALGTRLGPYEILAPIGAGGMGEVYKACDTRLDRIVAVKVSQQDFSERFDREARAVAALNHPNICTLHDVGPNYLVMEFVEGEPLSGPLPVEKTIAYARQILDALDHAHRKGIIHRDLKPANILVTKQGVKLLDFGLAKFKPGPLKETDQTLTKALTKPLTQGGQILGTLQYMSPEQLQSQDADARSDLFSFGCVLYELLTGKRPFDGPSAASVIAAILERPSPSISDVASPALERVLKRLLEKDPDQRFQTARDLKAALEWAAADGAQKTPAALGAAESAGKRSKFSAAGWIAAIVVTAAAAALAFVHAREQAPASQVVRFSIPPPKKLAYGHPQVSPDGKRIAFIAGDPGGKPSIWIRDLNSDSSRPVQGTEGVEQLFWSPDNSYLGFVVGRDIKKIRSDGGIPELLGEGSNTLYSACWAPDGNILVTVNLDGLYSVPAAGGTLKPFTKLNQARQETRHYWPSITPDGKHFLFLVTSSQPDAQGIWIAPLANPDDRKRLVADLSMGVYSAGNLLFVRNGNLVAQPFDLESGKPAGDPVALVNNPPFNPAAGWADFSISSNGVMAIGVYQRPVRLMTFDRAGKPLSVFGAEGRIYTDLAISPDQTLIAAEATIGKGYQISLFDPIRNATTQLVNGVSGGTYPVWSPDGSRIAFGSNRDGVFNLYIKPATGASEDTVLLKNSQNKFLMDWSRDGKYILYGENSPNHKDAEELWVLPMVGERKPVLFVQDGLDKRNAKFSPDGHSVAYAFREASYPEIVVRSFPSGSNKIQISTQGGSVPHWRDDGKEIFYLDPSGQLMAVSIRTEGDKLIAGAPQMLFETGRVEALRDFDVYKGGQRFVMGARIQSDEQPVSVILNWTGLLKK